MSTNRSGLLMSAAGAGVAALATAALGQGTCPTVCGTCPAGNTTRTVTYTAGIADAYALPVDPASPRSALSAYITALPNTTKAFDQTTINSFFAHTFSSLPGTIVGGCLEIRARAQNTITGNDTIALQFSSGPPAFAWGRQFQTDSGGTWNIGEDQTFTYNLCALPLTAGGTLNLIPRLNTDKFLDVTVEDDTTIDYVKLTLVVCQPCVPAPSQMTMWLPFDNQSGSLSSNIAGAGGGAAVLTGGPTFDAGKVAGSRRFSGANTQFASVPSYPGIQIGTYDFTIDMWVKLDGNVDGVDTLIDKRSTNPIVGYAYYLFDHDGNPTTPPVQGLQLAPTASTLQNFNSTTATAVPNDGAWHLIAVSVDRSGNATFYMDGTTSAVSVSSHPGNLSNLAALKVAGHAFSNPGFKGWMDEVEIFCRALDVSDLNSLYNAGAAGKCKVKVSVPWDSAYCSNLQSLTTNLSIQNLTGMKQLLEMHAGGVGPNVPDCNGPDPIAFAFPTLSPTTPPSLFSALPGVTSLPITVTRDPLMTSMQAACFQAYGVNQTTGELTVGGMGKLRRSPSWCIRYPGLPIDMDPNTLRATEFSVTNTGPETETLDYRIFSMASSGNMSPTPISLNSLPPDQDVLGSITLAPGAEGVVSVNIGLIDRTIEEMPVDITFAIDLDGVGGATRDEAVTSVRVEESVALILDVPGCDVIDFNNDGVSPDSQDLIDFLSVFGGGPCSNDPNCNDIDFNNDGVSPDSGDIDLLLLVFGGGAC